MSAIDRFASAVPPTADEGIAVAVDTTARAYDLTTLQLGGYKPDKSNGLAKVAPVNLHAEGGDIYIRFASDNVAAGMIPTAIVAVGGTLAPNAGWCARIPSGSTVPADIIRSKHKFVHIMTSTGTATLRMWAYAASE